MTFLFLGLLAAAWLAVILPAVLRARQTAPFTTAERFKRRLQLVAPRPSSGRWVVVPESRTRLVHSSFRKGQQRRARILAWLVTASIVSAVVTVLSGGATFELHLAIDASLAIYVVLLLEAKKRRLERVTKVRPLARPLRPEAERVVVLEAAHARRA